MSRACCKTFAFIFLGIIFAVPLFQGVWEKAVEGESLRVLGVFRKVPSEANLRSFEKELEESCKVADWLRPAYRQLRWLLMRDLGDKAVAAADGWAYYGPNIRYLGEGYFKTLKSENPGEDPAATIADFAAQLRRRGIVLLVVPVPSKPSIAPEHLRRGLVPSLDLSVHTRRFMDELRGQGVDVFDLFTPLVREQREHPDRPRLYLAADTHWTGDGVRLAATLLAERVRAMVGADEILPRRNFRRETVTVSRRPDIPRMSRLPGEAGAFPPEKTTAYRVLDEEGEPYADSDESRILLLGDSFLAHLPDRRAGGGGAHRQPGLRATNSACLHRQRRRRVHPRAPGTGAQPGDPAGQAHRDLAFAERDLRFGMKGWAKIALDE